jgi:hypothetical protein
LNSAFKLMIIGRWSELILFAILQLVYGIRSADAMLMSGAVDAKCVTLVGRSSLMIPHVCPVMVSARELPLVSLVASECQSSL